MGIFYAVFELVGRLLRLKVYQTARILPVFQEMNHGIGRPLALIAGGGSGGCFPSDGIPAFPAWGSPAL